MSFLIAARRSAVIPRNGAFADMLPHRLSAPVIGQALADCGLEANAIDYMIVSNVLGEGGNIARLCALEAGLPETVGALTIDSQCAGGLDALLVADAFIRAGKYDVIIAGGVESYSRQPIKLRSFADKRPNQPYLNAHFTPWPTRDPDMAQAADTLASRLSITQKHQDDWAIHSHQKALQTPADLLAGEIVPIKGVRADSFSRRLSAAHCARARRICGTITSANMAVAADGAAFVVMVSPKIARRLDAPMIALLDGVSLGGAPDMPGLAPVAAIDAILQASKMPASGMDFVELMEAFAAQAIACQQGSGLLPEKINIYGGALARGHPVGASGAILAVRLFHLLRRLECEKGKKGLGLAAIAAAGGLGTALLLKHYDNKNSAII